MMITMTHLRDRGEDIPLFSASAPAVKLPWQPFYWNDFLLSTTPLSSLELGLYTRLYGYYWQTGSLPVAMERCYRIAGAFTVEEQQAVIELLHRFFIPAETGYRHPSLDAQRDAQGQLAKRGSEKARDAAQKRWAKRQPSPPVPADMPSATEHGTMSEPMLGAMLEQCQLKSKVKTIGEESPITPLVESSSRPGECPVEPEITLPSLGSMPPKPDAPPASSEQLVIFPTLAPVASHQAGDIQTVFAHWQTVLHHPQAKLTKDRVIKIRTRLREGYTVENLKQAIEGASQDAFLMGDNDRQTRYDDLTTIFKNGGMVERLMEKHRHPTPGIDSPAHRGHRDGPPRTPTRFEHRQQQFERCVAKLRAAEAAVAQQGMADAVGTAYWF